MEQIVAATVLFILFFFIAYYALTGCIVGDHICKQAYDEKKAEWQVERQVEDD